MIAATILALLAFVATTSLVSIMVLFVGGGQAGQDIAALLTLQAIAVPISFGLIAFVIAVFVAAWGRQTGIRRLWSAIPQWLVFAYVLINSLTVAGELAMLIIYRAMGRTVPATEHVPLIALLATTTAFLLLYARIQIDRGPALSGRWKPENGPGTRGEPWEDDR